MRRLFKNVASKTEYRLYLDTSVFGALVDTEDPARIRTTVGFLRRLHAPVFRAFVGDPVVEEIARAPHRIRGTLESALTFLSPTLLAETDSTRALAEAYLRAGLVPEKRRNDARHIAIATVAALDALVSWNFRDMVNLRKKRIVNTVNLAHRYSTIDIVSPWEVPLG